MHSKKSFVLHLFKSMFYNCPTDFEYSLKHYQFSETNWYWYFNIVFRKQLPPLQQVFGNKKHGLKAAKSYSSLLGIVNMLLKLLLPPVTERLATLCLQSSPEGPDSSKVKVSLQLNITQFSTSGDQGLKGERSLSN